MRTKIGPRGHLKKRQRIIKQPEIAKLKSFIAVCFILLTLCHNSSPFSEAFKQSSKADTAQTVATAISDVIHEFYIANAIEFDFIIYGESSTHINDVTDGVIKLTQDKVPTTLKHVTDIGKWNHNMNQSAVLFIKRKETLQKLQEMIKAAGPFQLANIEPKAFKFLVYIEEIKTFNELQFLLSTNRGLLFWYPSDFRFFEHFITSDEEFVNLTANHLTTFNFKGNSQPVLAPKWLNSFDKRSKQWIKKLETFDIADNLNGLLITFCVNYINNFYIEDSRNLFLMMRTDEERFKKILSSENLKYAGAGYEVLQTLAQRHNFVPHITLINNLNMSLIEYPTRNYETSHFFGIVLPIEGTLMEGYDMSAPIGVIEYYYLVSLNDKYTNYEKLLFPFDVTTWTLLVLTFGLTFGTIFCLKRCTRRIKTVVFGTGITHPAFNALGIFFGISQLRLPRETFSRCVLLLFIWFCLIIRVCWQSMMFEFMTTDMRKPLPKTIDDLKDMNYTIVIPNGHILTENSEFLQENAEIINGRQITNIQYLTVVDAERLYGKTLNEELQSKTAFLVSNLLHAHYNSTFKHSLPAMHSEKDVRMNVFQLPRNHFLLQKLNHVINQLIPSGILQHLQKHGLWNLVRPVDIDVADSRRILSLSDLEFGFVIWLVVCLLSILSFLLELSVKLKRYVEKLLSLLSFLYTLMIRMNNFHEI